MAEEMIDIIEESNDEVENWIYYEPRTEETAVIKPLADQQLIYIDSTSLLINDNDQTCQYDCDDSLIINEENDQGLGGSGGQMEEQAQQPVENIDDTSKHNLILRESIDENGELVETYFCQQCNSSFKSIEDFLIYHPCVELQNENSELQEQQEDIVPTACEDKLWDLVENLDETDNKGDESNEDLEIKPNITNNDVELEGERYFCYDCQQVFNDLTTAETHDCIIQLKNSNDFTESELSLLVNKSDDNVYRCDLCDKEYTSIRSFNNHQRWHKKSDILSHSKVLHDDRTICDICNTTFASEKNLKLHMKMHKKQTVKTIQEALPVGAQNEYNELNKFFCEICNKSFDQKLLLIHKNMHQNLEEYTCGKCNKQFENLPSYEIHMQMHVDSIANVKKGNTFKTTNETNNADEVPSTSAKGLIDNGKRKFACQYCGKEFLRPYEKVKHERVHTGEKPYECEVCGKTFRVTYSLTLHLRTHTDIRPYVCATCNKRFKQQSVYVHHLKTHVVERGYKCEVCGKSFRTSVQLSGHRNIHSKPYNCTECNRPFASLYAVKIHMKTHNKGHKSNKNLKNRCSICGASYARVFALRFHIKEQHGIDIDPAELLEANSVNENKHKELDSETSLLLNAGVEKDYEEDDAEFISQVDHEENIQNPLSNNVYLDETIAATQTILISDEISDDHFSNEKIITDWLSQ